MEVQEIPEKCGDLTVLVLEEASDADLRVSEANPPLGEMHDSNAEKDGRCLRLSLQSWSSSGPLLLRLGFSAHKATPPTVQPPALLGRWLCGQPRPTSPTGWSSGAAPGELEKRRLGGERLEG